MKAHIATFYELSFEELSERVRAAREHLEHIRCRIRRGAPMSLVHEAFEVLDRFVPGVLASPRDALGSALWALSSTERQALRSAIEAERAARERVSRMLGEIPPTLVENALARLDARESVTAELEQLLGTFERARDHRMLA